MQSNTMYCHLILYVYCHRGNKCNEFKLYMTWVYKKLLKLESNNKIQISESQRLSRVHGCNKNWNIWKTSIRMGCKVTSMLIVIGYVSGDIFIFALCMDSLRFKEVLLQVGSTTLVCGNNKFCKVFFFSPCNPFQCHNQNQNAHSAYLTFVTWAK